MWCSYNRRYRGSQASGVVVRQRTKPLFLGLSIYVLTHTRVLRLIHEYIEMIDTVQS